MGKIVVIRANICYLVAADSSHVYPIFRKLLEPDIKNSNYDKAVVRGSILPMSDPERLNYFQNGPWWDYFKNNSQLKIVEEDLRQKIVMKMPKSGIFELTKNEFEDAFTSIAFAATELISFIEIYCWVSGIATCECLVVGDHYDYNFSLYEKSSLSMFGKKGNLIFSFRWSEFMKLRLTNHSHFEIITKPGSTGGWFIKGGFPSQTEFGQYKEALTQFKK